MQCRGTTPNDFVRLPLPRVEQILVESKCGYCGVRIVSSILAGLDGMEAEHRIECPKPPEKRRP